jgi:hypothetical protein
MGRRLTAGSPLPALLLLAALLVSPLPLTAEDFLFHSIRATLLVADPEAAGERLAAWA